LPHLYALGFQNMLLSMCVCVRVHDKQGSIVCVCVHAHDKEAKSEQKTNELTSASSFLTAVLSACICACDMYACACAFSAVNFCPSMTFLCHPFHSLPSVFCNLSPFPSRSFENVKEGKMKQKCTSCSRASLRSVDASSNLLIEL